MKKLGIASALVLVAAICGAVYFYDNLEKYVQPNLIPPASYWVNESKPLREQTALVEIGGRKFKIPLMYIDSKKPLDGVFKDDILLEVIWPDMRSIYELKDHQEYERVWKKEGRRGWIMIEAASARPSLDTQIASRRQFIAKEEPAGKVGELEKYLWYNGSPEGPKLWSEMYLEKDKDGHIVSYNECRNGSGVVVPGCSHKFVEDGLIYQIDYNEAVFFSQWREQERRAIDFLRSTEIRSDSKP